MRLQDHLTSSGEYLFRWRSYVLLAFVPFIFVSLFKGERIDAALGGILGNTYSLICIALVVAGEGIRILTVAYVPRGTSGRNVSGQLAEELNTTGIYSAVRNPLYLGNCLMYVGVALYTQNILLGLVLALVLLPYYERIIAAEEKFLAEKFGAPYQAWTEVTPAFIPEFDGWQSPAMRFSLKTVIRREQASIYGAVVALYLITIGLHRFGPEPTPVPEVWHWVFLIGSIAELAALWAKVRTTWLAVDGR